MRLESLKIYGFKSFADEVKFDFDAGMTSIVGPNGCGKSNVLDAINWALGEQSPSRLRGDKMEDMIFMGSKTRKPIGVSSVEFCVDNSGGLLPVDYDKVTVMRKLYRSGESEYYINKNPCRLKDIKELFMDTGIGTQSYSVMDQGDVSFILKCSPEERRGIIEEAAGIRKYKERKESAKRRLERTRQDLDEVKNILAEVKKNIRRLKRQSSRARRFREFKERLSRLEVNRLCYEYANLSDKLRKKLDQSGGIKDKVSSLSAEKSRLDAEVSRSEEDKSRLDEEIMSLSQQAYKLESKIEIIKTRVDNFDSELNRLDEEIERNREAKTYCLKRLKQLEEEMNQMESSRDSEFDEQVAELEEILKKKNSAIMKDEEQIRNLNKERERLENEISASSSEWSDLRAKTENLETFEKNLASRASDLGERVGNLRKQLAEKDAKIRQLDKEISSHSKVSENLANDIRSGEEKIVNMEAEREKILRDFHQTESEFDSGKKYLPQLLSMEKLSSQKIKGIEGPLFTVLKKKVSPQGMRKIAVRAGEKMSWMTAENRRSAEEAVSFLKEKNLPPLTFILTDKLPSKNSKLTEGENLSPILEKIISYITRGTREEGNLVFCDSCVVAGGGEIPPRTGRLLALEKDIEKLKEKLHQVEDNLAKEKEEKKNSSEEVSRKRKIIDKLNVKRSSLKQEKSNIKGRAEFTSGELKKVKEDMETLPSRDKLAQRARNCKQNVERSRKQLEEARKKVSSAYNSLRELRAGAASLEARKNMLSETALRKKDRFKITEENMEETRKEIKRLQRLIDNLNDSRSNIISRNKEDIENLQQLREEKKKVQRRAGELQQKRGNLTVNLKELKNRQKEKEIQLQRVKDAAADERQTEEILREKMSGIKIRMTEDMDVQLDEAMKNYKGEEVDCEEIRDLKAKLEKIGNVNLQAPEEFERENQRFEFIKRHVDDLEEADRNLRNIIRKINNQTKDRFRNTFNQVNENFARVFSRLFEGGQAKLSLLEPDNILESGIELSARPEGKKISSLKQLSGGERALVAIALMFAVFEVKPSPFCILDEVDAPLDDINLHRFLKMLKDYAQKTQFILITHNKQTMQSSDTFYGITMEEFGVSKVISVNLKEVKSASGE